MLSPLPRRKGRSCPSCFFAGMEPVDNNPYGRLRGTCAIHERRIVGGCDAFELERGEGVAPRQKDIDAARERLRSAA